MSLWIFMWCCSCFCILLLAVDRSSKVFFCFFVLAWPNGWIDGRIECLLKCFGISHKILKIMKIIDLQKQKGAEGTAATNYKYFMKCNGLFEK